MKLHAIRSRARIPAAALALALTTLPVPGHADEIPDRLVEQVRAWTAHPTVLITLRRWNARHEGLTDAEIRELDRQWRRQTDASQQPLIAQIGSAPLSNFLLRKQADAGGQFIEVFVMNARGLNVAISAVTSDYWQGDEAKFRRTYDVSPTAVHFGAVEVKDDTGHRAQQVSMTIADPDTGAPIGAITAEVDLDVAALYDPAAAR